MNLSYLSSLCLKLLLIYICLYAVRFHAAMTSQHGICCDRLFVEDESGINLIVFMIYLAELCGRMGLNGH